MARAQTVADVMTRDPATCDMTASIADVARVMRDRDIGAVVAVENDSVRGIVTDRDIVVRALADGGSPQETRVADVCSGSVRTLSPQDPIESAIGILREQHVRRIPVVEGERPVGILSIGDLAIERDPSSALADISQAPPNG